MTLMSVSTLSKFFVCIRCGGNVFTEPLPNNGDSSGFTIPVLDIMSHCIQKLLDAVLFMRSVSYQIFIMW
jgi:hypothetical protein